jgi:hypothetical protein
MRKSMVRKQPTSPPPRCCMQAEENQKEEAWAKAQYLKEYAKKQKEVGVPRLCVCGLRRAGGLQSETKCMGPCAEQLWVHLRSMANRRRSSRG